MTSKDVKKKKSHVQAFFFPTTVLHEIREYFPSLKLNPQSCGGFNTVNIIDKHEITSEAKTNRKFVEETSSNSNISTNFTCSMAKDIYTVTFLIVTIRLLTHSFGRSTNRFHTHNVMAGVQVMTASKTRTCLLFI